MAFIAFYDLLCVWFDDREIEWEWEMLSYWFNSGIFGDLFDGVFEEIVEEPAQLSFF